MGKRCGRREVKQRGKWKEGSVKERRKRSSSSIGRGKRKDYKTAKKGRR